MAQTTPIIPTRWPDISSATPQELGLVRTYARWTVYQDQPGDTLAHHERVLLALVRAAEKRKS